MSQRSIRATNIVYHITISQLPLFRIGLEIADNNSKIQYICLSALKLNIVTKKKKKKTRASKIT
jgi:hypothetical protein